MRPLMPLNTATAANAARDSADALPVLERAYMYFYEIEPLAIKYH